MSAVGNPLAYESIWLDKYRYDEAERNYYQRLAGVDDMGITAGIENKLQSLEKENTNLKKVIETLRQQLSKLETRVSSLEGGKKPAEKAAPAPADDDDVDLFGEDENDAEQQKLREQRLKEYEAKKSKKPTVIAKSNVILDIKPWDDETDMKAMEKAVREIKTDGLLWGVSKLVPVAYGVQKLQISSVVEDDKVSIDWLQEELEKIEDYVQSVDIAAFNKI